MTEFFKFLSIAESRGLRDEVWTVTDFVLATGCTVYRAKKIIAEARSLRFVLRRQNRYPFNTHLRNYFEGKKNNEP